MLLKVNQLCLQRQNEWVLDHLSFQMDEGSIVGLTGPNGGGKTTLFETLLGMHKPQSGSIEWSRAVEFAFVPQQLVPKKVLPVSVEEFVQMGEWGVHKKSKPALDLKTAISDLDLLPLVKKKISELSGGEWKRVTLARALVQAADLYLLDEPFNHLDLRMEDQIGHLLQKLSREQKKTFFVISHDWHAMDHYFDRLLLLNKRIIADGSVREVSEVSLNWRDPKHHEWMHHD